MTKSVAEVMTVNPITVKPQTLLADAIKIIAEKRISGMPVVNDEGKLVGVISESDLMWKETGVETPPYIMILDSVIYLQNPARYKKEIHKALGQVRHRVAQAFSNLKGNEVKATLEKLAADEFEQVATEAKYHLHS